jgi:hypothetical protein
MDIYIFLSFKPHEEKCYAALNLKQRTLSSYYLEKHKNTSNRFFKHVFKNMCIFTKKH